MAARALPNQRHTVLSIIGTRPEAIKMRPVLGALGALPFIEQRLLLTGQHRSLASRLAQVEPVELGVDLTEQSPGELCDALQEHISRHLVRHRPSMVVVQGDTTSALAGALAAKECGVPVAHVEAGLRSFDREPWPEESNRVVIDSLADLLFAPTKAAAANLASERRVKGSIHVTGNSGIDALLQAIRPTAEGLGRSRRRRIVVTSHRRENQARQLREICAALKRLVRELPVEILFLMHSDPRRRSLIECELTGIERIRLSDHVDHAEMVELLLGSWLVLTDSGGLQEDGPTLGRPVLVMRTVTERIEAPDNIALVGTDADAIFGAVHELLLSDTRYARMAKPAMPFGDGQAALRIAAIIGSWLNGRGGRAR